MGRRMTALLLAALLLSGCGGPPATEPSAQEMRDQLLPGRTAPAEDPAAPSMEIPTEAPTDDITEAIPEDPTETPAEDPAEVWEPPTEPDPELPPAYEGLAPELRAAVGRALSEGRTALVWFAPPAALGAGMRRLETEEEGEADFLFLALEDGTRLRVIRGQPSCNAWGVATGAEGKPAADLTLNAGEGVWFPGALVLGVPLYHLLADTSAGSLYCGLSYRMHSLLDGPLGLLPGAEASAPPEYGAETLVENSQHLLWNYWDPQGRQLQAGVDAPRLRLESPDARLINEEIVLRASREVRNIQEAWDYRNLPSPWGMDYVAALSPSGVLSLVLRVWGHQGPEYIVYTLTEEGRRLTGEELTRLRAAELDRDPETWWPQSRQRALRAAAPVTEGPAWEATLADPLGLSRLYLDRLGRLCMAAPLYTAPGVYTMAEILVG